MKTIRKEWINWIIILIPFIFIALNWEKFPERVPTHFGLDGTPDAWGSKVTGLILFPSINIGMYLLMLALPFLDPRKKNYVLFEGKFRIIRTFLHLFLSFITLVVCFVSLGYQIDVGNMICFGVLALFMVLGNYMGTVRSNYFIGIRVPWTLENETVWTLTHRLAGRLWVFGSLGMIIFLYFFPGFKLAMVPFFLVITVVPIVYAYIKYKQLTPQKKA
jgi:uncharacterized membrane protein